MNESERKQFAEEIGVALKNVLDERGTACELCATEERRQEHRQHHEFIASLIELADRMNNAKWGILSAVIKAVLVAAILGGIAFAWKHGIKGS